MIGTDHSASIAGVEGCNVTSTEVEADGRGDGPRGHIVSSAEGGEEVIQGFLVGQIDHRQASAPFISIAVEDVVVADGGVEKVARGDTGWIVVGIIGTCGRDAEELRAVLRRRAKTGGANGSRGRGVGAAAEESGLKLLVGSQVGDVDDGARAIGSIVAIASGAGHRAGDKAAIVTPVEAEPRTLFPGLILQVGRLVEMLVVIDAEHSTSGRGPGANAADLRSVEAGRNTRHDDEGGEAVEVGHAGANRISGDFGAGPFDGIKDGRCAEDAEIVSLMRIFPDVLAVDHQKASKGLGEAGMELIAMAGAQRHVGHTWPGGGRLKRVDHRIVTSDAGQYQVLVEGTLHGAGVGNSQQGAGRLEVVCNANARLGLPGDGEAVVQIASNPEG